VARTALPPKALRIDLSKVRVVDQEEVQERHGRWQGRDHQPWRPDGREPVRAFHRTAAGDDGRARIMSAGQVSISRLRVKRATQAQIAAYDRFRTQHRGPSQRFTRAAA